MSAALSPATIRSRAATAIDAVLGWRVSRWAGQNLVRESDDRLHKCASVEVTRTEPIGGQTYKSAEGAWCYSELAVHWAYRLRGDSQITDYDAAIGEELKLIEAVEGMSLNKLHIIFKSSERPVQTPESDWIIGRLLFRAQHILTLTG